MDTLCAADILAEVSGMLADTFDMIEWAESEIEQARKRHPDQADTLFHTFALLSPRDAMVRRMKTEVIFRAHAHELLERVASGEDTRPATAVEIIIGLLEAGTNAPLTHEGFGLCARMWAAAGLPDMEGLSDTLGHYEAISSGRLDEEERRVRHACRNAGRQLGPIECGGRHHGERVDCIHAEQASAD